jgi:GcrA cell cycle regulator
MWKAGRSAAEIGLDLGRTRAAVIGKVHRLGLSKASRRAPQDPLTPRKSILEKPRAAPIEATSTGGGVIPVKAAPQPPRAPSAHLSVMQLRYRKDCAYPVSGHNADTLFCGRSVTGGSPYCPKHYKIVYVKRI